MPIDVLIAEDSAFQRKLIGDILNSHEDINVIGIARNGKETLKKVEKFNPDVLVLDLTMPEMGGLEVFKFLSEHYPIPTIIFSVQDPANLEFPVQALLLGAVDYIQKPTGEWKTELPKSKDKLINSVIIASKINKNYKIRHETFREALNQQIAIKEGSSDLKSHEEKPSDEIIKEKSIKRKVREETRDNRVQVKIKTDIIVMGASVGGPKTLKAILATLPKDLKSPILIVQHMNEFFVKQFADSLNQSCAIEVKIPSNGEIIKDNTIYLAPGGKHMEIMVHNNVPAIRTFKGEPVNYCQPAVDVLFLSAAKIYKSRVMGIILTGMGNDGVTGLGAIKDKGGKTIAESKETCILYGMPKIAAERGVAQMIVPNYKVKDYIIKYSRKKV